MTIVCLFVCQLVSSGGVRLASDESIRFSHIRVCVFDSFMMVVIVKNNNRVTAQ